MKDFLIKFFAGLFVGLIAAGIVIASGIGAVVII